MIYPDTEAGAIQCLADDSSLDTTGATAVPDWSVEGVWKVILKDGRAVIVYLAGYKDPWKNIRECNDFEMLD